MLCDRCGAERSRTGPCPECGAPPPRPGARGASGGRSYAEGSSSGSRRTQGTSGGGLLSRGSSSGRRSNDRRQREDQWDSWDDEPGYTVPPTRSGGRSYSSGDYGHDSYGSGSRGVDPSRALMPQYAEPMLPTDTGLMAGVPGVPGLPESDEEERSLGIRRPVYIPATEQKRKRKLSSWRVISGLLSITLVTIGLCGGIGFLGQRQLANLIANPIVTHFNSQAVDLSQVPATPASTPGPQAKIVTSAVTARQTDNQYRAIDETSYFPVNSTVYVVVNVVGAPQNATSTLTCHWFLNGIDYDLHGGTQALITPTKSTNYHGYCGLHYYQTGVGMVKVYWGLPVGDTSGTPPDKYLAQTIKFAVVAKLPTPSPSSGKGTPSPTPKKADSGALTAVWRSPLNPS